jgi:peroxiredoxin
MATNPSLSATLVNTSKKNDIFLLVLLIASLSLNVYLGWKVKRLGGTPSASQNTVKLSPGMTVQPITAMNLGGKQETISYAEHGKPTVIYVFTPSCTWCNRNNQNINTIVSLKRESFRFIGLSLADDGLSGYVESHHLTFPVYRSLAPESIEMLGLGSTPQTIVISPDGRIVKNWVGAFGGALKPQIEEFFNVQLPGLTIQNN